MVLSNNRYVPLTDTNAITSIVPCVNRLRRIERCELECGKGFEAHCLRFDILLGCAAYLAPNTKLQQLNAVHKVFAYMIRCEYIFISSFTRSFTYHLFVYKLPQRISMLQYFKTDLSSCGAFNASSVPCSANPDRAVGNSLPWI